MSLQNRKSVYENVKKQITEGNVTIRMPAVLDKEFGMKKEPYFKKKEDIKEVEQPKEGEKFTEEQIIAMKKDKQVEILTKLGVSVDDIKKLKYEADRVKKILEVQ